MSREKNQKNPAAVSSGGRQQDSPVAARPGAELDATQHRFTAERHSDSVAAEEGGREGGGHPMQGGAGGGGGGMKRLRCPLFLRTAGSSCQ